jgi:uncharacterized protein
MSGRNIIWQALDKLSLEYCTINEIESQITINSVIIGYEEPLSFKVLYQINLAPDWQVRSAEIKIDLDGKETIVSLNRDNYDNWLQDRIQKEEFSGCREIDISLTPLTNSLITRGRSFVTGEPQKVKVVYIDVLELQIKPVEQVYTQFADSTFQFENTNDDFKALIEFDDHGLVTRYPGLFEMILNKEFKS